MYFLNIVARGVWLWFALGRDYPRGSRESFGHFVTPPVFLPFTSACRTVSFLSVRSRDRVSLCGQRVRQATFALAYPLGVLGVRVSCACVVCWSGFESREGQVNRPSLMGPGSSEVLESNLRHEPELTRTRTDSQHVRGPSPPLVGFL